MTHHTDAEQLHQLLELVLTELDRKAIPIAYMQEIDRKGKAFIEQAARRAPAVPVPQIAEVQDSLVAISAAIADQDDSAAQSMLRDLLSMLAAAPQPPEAGCSVSNGETQAAPVQLPEPQAEIEVRSMKTYLDLSIHEWRDTLPDGAYNIYTEQQVRELLAAHGIQEQST